MLMTTWKLYLSRKDGCGCPYVYLRQTIPADEVCKNQKGGIYTKGTIILSDF